jgi:hypothetical protein
MFGDQKVRLDGTAERIWWTAPEPLSSGSSPTLNVYLASGTATLTFANIAAVPAITAVARDRKTLTASGAVSSARGAQGAGWGEAFLVTAKDGWFPITVREISNATIILAEPLPAPLTVSAGAPASLQFATWAGVLTTTHVNAVERDVRWTVSYVTQAGVDLTGYSFRDEGLLHIVRQPFSTGLTTRHVVQVHPGLAQRVPRRQGGWEPQIQAAQEELILRLRRDLQERGLTEDDINGHRLRFAHAHLAAAVIYDENQPEKAEILRTRVLGAFNEETGIRHGGLVDDTLRSVWVDADRDGAVDSGEVTSIEGNRTADSKSFFTSSSFDSTNRVFSRGGRH